MVSTWVSTGCLAYGLGVLTVSGSPDIIPSRIPETSNYWKFLILIWNYFSREKSDNMNSNCDEKIPLLLILKDVLFKKLSKEKIQMLIWRNSSLKNLLLHDSNFLLFLKKNVFIEF